MLLDLIHYNKQCFVVTHLWCFAARQRWVKMRYLASEISWFWMLCWLASIQCSIHETVVSGDALRATHHLRLAKEPLPSRWAAFFCLRLACLLAACVCAPTHTPCKARHTDTHNAIYLEPQRLPGPYYSVIQNRLCLARYSSSSGI